MGRVSRCLYMSGTSLPFPTDYTLGMFHLPPISVHPVPHSDLGHPHLHPHAPHTTSPSLWIEWNCMALKRWSLCLCQLFCNGDIIEVPVLIVCYRTKWDNMRILLKVYGNIEIQTEYILIQKNFGGPCIDFIINIHFPWTFWRTLVHVMRLDSAQHSVRIQRASGFNIITITTLS